METPLNIFPSKSSIYPEVKATVEENLILTSDKKVPAGIYEKQQANTQRNGRYFVCEAKVIYHFTHPHVPNLKNWNMVYLLRDYHFS